MKDSGILLALLGVILAALLLIGTAKFEWQLFSVITIFAPSIREGEDVIIEVCNQFTVHEPGTPQVKTWVDNKLIDCFGSTGCKNLNIGQYPVGEHIVTICGGSVSESWMEKYGKPCDFPDIFWITPEDCESHGFDRKDTIFYVYPIITTTTTIPTTTSLTTTVFTTTSTTTTTIPQGWKEIIWSFIQSFISKIREYIDMFTKWR